MKWDLTRACIDRAVKEAVFGTGSSPGSGTNRCFSGNLDSGYWFSLDHDRDLPHQPEIIPEADRPAMRHYTLPPVTRDRASVEPGVVLDYRGEPEQTFDPWGGGAGSGFHLQGLYAHFAEGVDHVFEGWDQLPDERDFWEAANAMRDAIGPVSEPMKQDGPLFHVEWNLGVSSATYDPNSAGPPAPMKGQVIEVLTNYYVVPLGGTLAQQHWLGLLVAAELEGLGDMWHTARRCVMEIGRIATEVMQGQGTVEDALANLSVIGSVMTVVSLIPAVGEILAPVSVVLLAVEAIEQHIADNRGELEAAIQHQLSSATSDTILDQLRAALGELREHITTEEGTAEHTWDFAYQKSFDRPRIEPPDS